MKIKTSICLLLIIVMLFASCSPGAAASASPTTVPETPSATATLEPTVPSASAAIEPTQNTDKIINVYAISGEILGIIGKFLELHPDFTYTINRVLPEIDANNTVVPVSSLDHALSGSGAPDVYLAEAEIVTRYTQGEMSGYALSYEDLGIDVRTKIAEADIAQYTVDIGTRPCDNAVVGLSYKSSGGAFLYRRSIAKKVWGTDDPEKIASKIGPGWDRFFEAAEDLKKEGYSIVSGDGVVWYAAGGSIGSGWIVNGKLNISPERIAFMDYSKELIEKGYSRGNHEYTDAWRSDMLGTGEQPVFGFFATAWMVNNVVALECGDTFGDWAVCEPPVGFIWPGNSKWVLVNKALENDPEKKAAVAELVEWMTLDCTEEGLQFFIASGSLFAGGVKNETVASGTVMALADGKLDMLSGQNMYDVYRSSSDSISGVDVTEYDAIIDNLWREAAGKYSHGECTRDEAIAAFKQDVKERFGYDAW